MYKLNLPLFILVILLPIFSNAQGWERSFSGGHMEFARNADLTLEGGMIISGIQYNIGASTRFPLLYKVDIDGTLLWEYYDTVHVGGNVNTYDVESAADGSYLHAFTYGSVQQSSDYLLQKIDNAGNVIWEKTYPDIPEVKYIHNITECADGSFLLMGAEAYASVTVLKIDVDGTLIWSQNFEMPGMHPGEIIEAANGDVVVLAYFEYIDSNFDPFIKRLTSDGTELWEQLYDNSGDNDHAYNLIEMSNGDFVMGGLTRIGDLPNWSYEPNLRRVDAQGNELWAKAYPNFSQALVNQISLQKTAQGDLVLGGTTSAYGPGDANFHLMKFDGEGNSLWDKIYGTGGNDYAVQILNGPEQGFYMAGSTSWPSDGDYIFAIRTDSLGETFTNQLKGTVFNDENGDCLFDDTEAGLSQWFIEISDGVIDYSRVTDGTGYFEINVDTGTYEVKAHPISPYWEFCDSTFTFDMQIFGDTIIQDFAAQAIIDCPLMEVSIGTSFLRRCFDNTYNVQYCNLGTLLAEDAYINVILDPYMEFLGASIPLTVQVDDTLTFDLGDLEVGACGDFQIDVSLEIEGEPCDSLPFGLTHCVEAHIYPDSICLPSNNWSGASIEVDAVCESDSVVFFIENVGDAATQPNLGYIVIEDDVILMQGEVTLDAGQIVSVPVITDGSTFRLEAAQEPNHPGMSMPSISVEGCGTDDVEFNFGFINIFSPDDANPFVDVDCRENMGAYDPNDKIGFPIGVGASHFINQGEDIEYLIRFQNTGTDTAFNVVVLDTLSENLEITSLRLGASSHPFTFDITGARTLSFNFDNIMLPDSNVNEVASHGFVKFKIAQTANLEVGTPINNSAAIFFDFNAPIITNQTLHTIGEDFLNSVSFYPDANSFAEVKVFPNPFDESTTIEVEGLNFKNGTFKVYDVMGRLVRTETFRDSIFVFYKNNLLAGMYFFTIEEDGVLVGSGKLIAE